MYFEVEQALQKKYPDLGIVVDPRDYNCRLRVTFIVGEKRFYAMTPEGMDYKALSAPEWIHRFALEIEKKLP